MRDGPRTIVRLRDWLRHQAQTKPHAPALIYRGTTTTYNELEARAQASARRLWALGVRATDRVATTLAPGVEFAALMHACSKLGAVVVPLNTRLTAAERRWQVEDCGARVVVAEPLSGPEAGCELRETHDRGDCLALMYTSGTTSRPRQVCLSYQNFLASAEASASNIGVVSDDRWLCVLPVFHIGGLSIFVRSCIYGTAAIVHESFEAEAVARSLQDGEATLVSVVATMLRRLADCGLEQAPRLRAALVGGGPVPTDLLEWAHARGLPICQTYGLTETCSQVATLDPAQAHRYHGAAGRPLSGAEIAISTEGEILVRGPMVAAGALSADGWCHTGDRGRLDAEGMLWVEGRIADTIVTGGENVAAVEVEDALTAHPAVREAAVVGMADQYWGQAVTAFLVCDREVTDRELGDHCRARLAAFKVPKAFHRTDALPRNAGGKLLRRLLVA